MSNYKIIIKIDIQQTSTPTSNGLIKSDDGSFRIVLPQEAAQSIDTCEKALLTANYPALREALSNHLSAISKEEVEKPEMYRMGTLKKTRPPTM